MATPLFNPVFQLYNQAITDADRNLQVTEYIANDDPNKILTQQQYEALPGDPEDKCYDYSSRTAGPVTDAVSAKGEHTAAIHKVVKNAPITTPGKLNLASTR